MPLAPRVLKHLRRIHGRTSAPHKKQIARASASLRSESQRPTLNTANATQHDRRRTRRRHRATQPRRDGCHQNAADQAHPYETTTTGNKRIAPKLHDLAVGHLDVSHPSRESLKSDHFGTRISEVMEWPTAPRPFHRHRRACAFSRAQCRYWRTIDASLSISEPVRPKPP